MRKEILMMGLAGLLGCFEKKYDISRVDENIELTKPVGCETVKDVRYEYGYSAYSYQILCSDKEGNLTLYNRNTVSDNWQNIRVR